jgi:hypothetical protein
MLVNATINTFVGLALSFGVISLIVSTVVEAIASVLGWRSSTLLSGLQSLLNDKKLGGLALDVLNHGSANPLSAGDANSPPQSFWQNLLQKLPGGGGDPLPASVGAAANIQKPLAKVPSYIAPDQFAEALIDVIRTRGQPHGTEGDLRTAIKSIPDLQLQTMLLGMYDGAGQELGAFHQRIASWFDASMDRLSGAYKRRIQVCSFCIALGLAALLNVDAIALAKQLWVNPTISAIAASITDQDMLKTKLDLWSQSFPIGWTLPKTVAGPWTWPAMGLGWLPTATATLFGAPFWFDTLQRFVQLRGTGTAPGEKHS